MARAIEKTNCTIGDDSVFEGRFAVNGPIRNLLGGRPSGRRGPERTAGG